MKTREEKIAYVTKQIPEGYETYYGVDVAGLSALDDERLSIEYDCAINWAGEE